MHGVVCHVFVKALIFYKFPSYVCIGVSNACVFYSRIMCFKYVLVDWMGLLLFHKTVCIYFCFYKRIEIHPGKGGYYSHVFLWFRDPDAATSVMFLLNDMQHKEISPGTIKA